MSEHGADRKRRRGSLTGSVEALSIDAARMAPMSLAPGAVAPSDSEQHASNTDSTLQRSSLLDLPAEILLQITTQLCGTKAVLDVAVANKRLRDITLEAMAKKLVIPPNRIKQTIEMLTRRPELISRVDSVDLGAYMAAHTKQCVCISETGFDRKARRLFRNLIPISTNGQVTWNLIQELKRKRVWLWSPNHQFLMAILLSLCPNAKHITMQMPKVIGFDRSPSTLFLTTVTAPTPTPNPEVRPATLFQGPVLAVMQSKLRSLTIPPNSKWIGPVKHEILVIENDVQWRRHGKNIITLKGFNKLKHLDLPMDLLGLPANIIFQGSENAEVSNIVIRVVEGDSKVSNMMLPAKVLPLSLTTITLRSCTKHAFAILQRINEIAARKLKLKNIKVHFDTCARTSIFLCYLEDHGNLDYLALLTELSAKGVEISFFTGPDAQLTDMRAELVPLYSISPCTSGIIALASKQFSSLNTTALRRRHFSHPLFPRHALSHFDLFNSPTFNAKSWEHVQIFHGIRNTKYDPQLRDKEGGKVHIKAHVEGLDDHVFGAMEKVEMPKEWMGLRAVVFMGRVFSLLTSSQDADDVEMQSDEPNEPVHKGKIGTGAVARKVVKEAPKVKARWIRSTKKREVKQRPSIVFKGEERVAQMNLGEVFDRGVWAGAEWRAWVQP